jgi:hypothetical protein
MESATSRVYERRRGVLEEMSLPYSEGSVFLVPLRKGGYARGVVTRSGDEGKVLLGYFFGPKLTSRNEAALEDLDPANAILRVMFGDLGLINGEWRVVGMLPNWNRSKWPMPDFVRRDELSRRAWLVRYSDDDPNRKELEYPTHFDSKLQRDSLYGYGAVEIALTKLLG